MTTLDDLYTLTPNRVATKTVYIDNIPLEGVQSVEWSFALDRVPTATIRIPNPRPTYVRYFASVQIDVGFENVEAAVFRGVVLNANQDSQGGCTIECVGRSWVLDVSFHKVLLTLNNLTAEAAVTNLLTAAGLAGRFDVSLPVWTIGAVVPQTLEFQTYGDGVSKVLSPLSAHWFEHPSGIIYARVIDLAPSLTSNKQYFSMVLAGTTPSYPPGISSGLAHLRKASISESAREVKNQIFVRGATISTANPDGSTTSSDIEAELAAPSPYVLNPDGSPAYNDFLFSNELIDTSAMARQVAAQKLAELNRLQVKASAMIDGDPRLVLGETVQVEDPAYSSLTDRWLAESYSSRLDGSDFASSVALRTGGVSVGPGPTPGNLPPIAAFLVSINYQFIDDRQWALVTFDGRPSHDPDGIIAAYLWSDNQTPDIATGTAAIFTAKVDPATLAIPWNVTLTVTDDAGATDSVTQTIDIASETNPDVMSPSLFVAFETDFSATPGGTGTWNDRATPGSSTAISVDASPTERGVACYGTKGTASEAPKIYRTTDYCKSALTEVRAIEIVPSNEGGPLAFVDIFWETSTVVWALAVSLGGLGNTLWSVERSDDAGLTWSRYDKPVIPGGQSGQRAIFHGYRIDAQAGLPRIFGTWRLPTAAGGGWFPAVLLRTAAGSWKIGNIGGELGEDAGNGGPGALSRIYIADFAYRERGELAIILNRTNATPFPASVYYTRNFYGDGSAWRRGTNLPAPNHGRFIVADEQNDKFSLAFDNQTIYLATVTGGVLNVDGAAAASLSGDDKANHGLWLSKLPRAAGIIAVAAEGTPDGTIYLTSDQFATIGGVRPATGVPDPPAGANAKMIAIGPGAGSGAPGLLLAESPWQEATYSRRVARLGASWTLVADPVPGLQFPLGFMRRVGVNLFRLVVEENVGAVDIHVHPGQLQRSTDGGATWASIGPSPVNGVTGIWGVNNIVDGADGTLWLCTCTDDPTDLTTPAPRVYRSTTAGASWTQIYEDATQDAGEWRRFIDICAHPNNPDQVAVLGDQNGATSGDANVWVTTNGGSTFTRNTGALEQSTTGQRRCVMLDNGRIVAQMGTRIGTTDDYGDTWVDREANPDGRLLVAGANHICFISADTDVLRSRDYGQTWTVIYSEPSLASISGLYYDEINDALYIATDSEDGVPRTVNVEAAGSSKAGAASVTLSWTLSESAEWLLGLLAVKPALAAPVVMADAGQQSSGGSTGVSSLTSNIATAGSNRLLLVAVALHISTPSDFERVDNILFQLASPLTFVAAVNDASNDVRIEFWRLIAPEAGVARNLVCTLAANGTGLATMVMGIWELTGVHQTTPLGALTSATGISTAPSATIGSAVNELVVGAMAAVALTPPQSTPDVGQSWDWGDEPYSPTSGGPDSSGVGVDRLPGASATTPGAVVSVLLNLLDLMLESPSMEGLTV